MLSEESYQEKTEKPSSRKLEKAKQQGNVPKSTEVPSALILLISMGVFMFAGSWMFWNLADFMRGIFENAGTLDLDAAALSKFITVLIDQILLIIMPLMLPVLIAGICGNVIQFGFLLTSEPFIPKISKLNPIKGLKKIVSLKSFVEVIKSLFKFGLIGTIAFLVVKSEMEAFPGLMQMTVSGILSFFGAASFKICFNVCLALILLAMIDFTYQRWQHEKDLRMTKQEVRDEAKQTEGDPKVKSKIKQIQLETARRRMMEQVPAADAVITNPTHLAVAIQYEHKKMPAPKVVAKGAGFIALKIKEIAERNSIPVIENKPLAQTLFKIVELNEYIPVTLYRAVAEVLAYVYKLRQNKHKI